MGIFIMPAVIAAGRPVPVDVEYQVGAGADDGCVIGSTFYVSGTTVENQVGDASGDSCNNWNRWTGIAIPPGAEIISAEIQYKSKGNYTTTSCKTRIFFNAADSATAPTSVSDYNSKAVTGAYADWTIGSWSTDAWYSSPDISVLIQEVINRPGWQKNNALMALHKNNGSSTTVYRRPLRYESGAANAAKLLITYRL